MNSAAKLEKQPEHFTRTAAALYKNSSGAEIKRRCATGLRRQSIRHAIDAGLLDQTNPFKTVGLTLWVATAILNAFTLFGALP